MLHQENKNLLLLLLYSVCSICLFSCTDKSTKLQKEWLLYKDYSSQFVTQELYEQVLQKANDSITNWLSYDLPSYAYEKNNDWRLDSLLCFNKRINKCIMTLMVRDTLYKPANSDGVSYLYGVKIRNTWYFFRGPQMVVPREFYQEDIHTPLSFDKLRQIATSNIYRGYLKKGKKGQWEVNDDFFNNVLPPQKTVEFYGFKTAEEYIIRKVMMNWDNSMLLSPSGK